MNTTRSIAAALALLLAAAPALAQHHDHTPPATTPPPAEAEEPTPPVDSAAMDHGAMDHGAMDHGSMDHAAMGHAPPAITPVPAPTAADRAAAVKPAQPHPAHDDRPHSFVLFDRLEASRADGDDGFAWDTHAWWGTDLDRLWLRSHGELADGDLEHAQVELLYGHSLTPWWDVVAGVRHDTGTGPSQTFAAFGLQGLAPYKYELEATAYVGTDSQAGVAVEAEYDTLLGRRLVLQWVAEADAYTRSDRRRDLAAGLNSVEVGARLRVEVTRRFAPYVGVAWERRFGDAADWRRADGEDAAGWRVVAGVRLWF